MRRLLSKHSPVGKNKVELRGPHSEIFAVDGDVPPPGDEPAAVQGCVGEAKSQLGLSVQADKVRGSTEVGKSARTQTHTKFD